MFVKLFTQILDSSIADNRKLRHFFKDLLLCADLKGFVMMTDAAIARRIGSDIEEVKWGLSELQKPDPMSKTPDMEGARIERLEGIGYGWRIINFDYYRSLKSADEMREKTKDRVRKYREKKAGVTPCNATVTPCNAGNTTQKQKEKQRQTQKENTVLSTSGRDGYPDFIERIWPLFPASGRNRSSKQKIHEAWRKTNPKPDEDSLVLSLVKWTHCEDWQKESGRFVPGAHIWIKDRKWESEPVTVAVNGNFAGTRENIQPKLI